MALRYSALVFLLTLGASGCGSSDEPEPVGPPEPGAAGEPGPYAVGVTTIETVSEGRALPVEVWYPARPGAGSEAEKYAVMIGAIKLTEAPSPLGAVRDAPLDMRGAPYPVVLFSHGSGGIRIQSVYMTEYLASHGFVVAAPDHVGNTIAEEVNTSAKVSAAEMARIRPSDMSATLDTLLESAGTVPLDRVVDAASVGIAGHSFGGYTAFRIAGATVDPDAVIAECQGSSSLVCDGLADLTQPFPASARDERVSVALPQAPGGSIVMNAGGHDGFGSITIPTLVQHGTDDELTPFDEEARSPFEALSGPAWLLGIDGAGHFTFSDMCLMVELTGLNYPQFDDGCGPKNIPYAEAHAITNRTATAFFQLHLRGLDGFASELDPQDPLPEGIAVLEKR